MSGLLDIFNVITPISNDDPDKPIYAVMPMSHHESYFIGKDNESRACLLISTIDHDKKGHAPIRLESLDVQFDLRCRVRKDQQSEREDMFTVVRCRSLDQETIHYFLSICDTIARIVGDRPAQRSIASVVNRLATIFQKMQAPPTRPVIGLFGELFLIWRSSNPARALAAWRVDQGASFDFSDGEIRLDIKAAGGRVRTHTFSYDQCNPPKGTIAIVASLFVERSPAGTSLRSMIDEIERRLTGNIDLAFKLHEVITGTLGTNLKDALAMKFDEKLADASMRFFSLYDVPAIRGPLPPGISDVHFRSDLSALHALSAQNLIREDPVLLDLLPTTMA
jgi:hypothetical protein